MSVVKIIAHSSTIKCWNISLTHLVQSRTRRTSDYKAKFNQYVECCVIKCPAEFGKPNEGNIDMMCKSNLHSEGSSLMEEGSIKYTYHGSNLTVKDVNMHRTEGYLYSAAKYYNTPFLDEVKYVQFDSLGLEHKINGYDITIRVPEGSVSKGQTVHLKVGAVLTGPFRSSSGKRPISPILWLCPEGKLTLLKPIEVVFPIILTNVTVEDIQIFGIQVAKANHHDCVDDIVFKPFKLMNEISIK